VLDEVLWLLAHGLLHLVGWDHDTPARDARMRAETKRLFAAAKAPARGAARIGPTRPKRPRVPTRRTRKIGVRAR
jgi:probable rRNA maturation factor